VAGTTDDSVDPTDQPFLYRRLAETYSNRGSVGAWERVEQFRRVEEYRTRNPNKKSQAIATALDLPRSRIRPWVDGNSRPDPVRAIGTMERRNWDNLAWRGDTLAALNVLLAWIYSGGSIDVKRYVPGFTTTGRTHQDLIHAADELGITFGSRHEDEESRATELVPSKDASIFGRLLVALGAPIGSKSDRDSPSLPDYLQHPDCPYHLGLDFARVAVRNRGTKRPDRPNHPVQLTEQRSEDYSRSFRTFLGDIVGDHDAIRGQPDSNVTFLMERAAGTLCARPTFGTYLD